MAVTVFSVILTLGLVVVVLRVLIVISPMQQDCHSLDRVVSMNNYYGVRELIYITVVVP